MLKVRSSTGGALMSGVMLAAVICLVLGMVVADVQAGKKLWNVDGFSTTLAPTKIDTSQVISTSRCDDLMLTVAFDGDSATVYVDGSFDGATYINLWSEILDGVEGTVKLLFNGPMTSRGTANRATSSEYPVPPLRFTRIRLSNHDKAGADTLKSITVQLRCTQ